MPEIRREVHHNRLLPSFSQRPANLDAMLRAAVAAGTSNLAVIDGERRVTYGELDAAVDRIAANLARRGIGRGDRVGVILGNCAAFVEAVSYTHLTLPTILLV